MSPLRVVDFDEDWPVLGIYEPRAGQESNRYYDVIDVPQDLIDRWAAARDEWSAAQDSIDALLPEAARKRNR